MTQVWKIEATAIQGYRDAKGKLHKKSKTFKKSGKGRIPMTVTKQLADLLPTTFILHPKKTRKGLTHKKTKRTHVI